MNFLNPLPKLNKFLVAFRKKNKQTKNKRKDPEKNQYKIHILFQNLHYNNYVLLSLNEKRKKHQLKNKLLKGCTFLLTNHFTFLIKDMILTLYLYGKYPRSFNNNFFGIPPTLFLTIDTAPGVNILFLSTQYTGFPEALAILIA